MQYCNPDFDALITQAAAEPDQDKQVALYNQAQTILMNDAAMLPLRFGIITYEVQPYVGGMTPTGSDAVAPGDLFYEETLHQGPLIAVGDQYRWAGHPAGPAARPFPHRVAENDRDHLPRPAHPLDHPGAVHGLDHHLHPHALGAGRPVGP